MGKHSLRKTIIDSKLSQIQSDFQVSSNDALTYLINYLIQGRDYSDIDEIENIDGPEDKGIDLIYLSEESSTISILQIKNSTTFSSNSVVKLKNGLKWVFETTNFKQLKNANLRNRIGEIREFISEKFPGQICIKVYFITLGDTTEISRDFNQEWSLLHKDFENTGFKEVSFKLIGASELVELLNKKIQEAKGIDADFKIDYDRNTPSVVERSCGSIKAKIFSISATELVELVSRNLDNVFNHNIRQFLGTRKKINRNILNTCSSKTTSNLFWFFNNGITMTCDSCDFDPYTSFRMKVTNLQIINGCQTSMSLLEAYEKGIHLPNTSVLVRLYITKDKSFIDNITETTNSQNSVRERDLRANNSIQIDIEQAIKKYGYLYERKVNQYSGQKINPTKIINNEKLGQSVMSVMLKQPSVARSRRNELWGVDKHDLIFARPIAELFWSYLLFLKSSEFQSQDKKIKWRDDVEMAVIKYGQFHIMRIMHFFIMGKDKVTVSKIEEKINNVNEEEFKKAYDWSVPLLTQLLHELKDKYGSSLYNFFKSSDSQFFINQVLRNVSLSEE